MEVQYIFRPQAINRVNQSQLDKVMATLAELGYRIFTLDGKNIHDKLSYLAQAAQDLPQPPDLVSRNNWDAFNDSLWFGLHELLDNRVAFVWTDAQDMMHGDQKDFLIAVDILEELSGNVAHTEHRFSHPMDLRTFLFGEGDEFPVDVPGVTCRA